jgi:hypothetical protein
MYQYTVPADNEHWAVSVGKVLMSIKLLYIHFFYLLLPLGDKNMWELIIPILNNVDYEYSFT